MMDDKKPRLGEQQVFGPQFRVYTLRGWVICDTKKEVESEMLEIESMLEKK